jgi:iron complex transport system substrate-binding protein
MTLLRVAMAALILVLASLACRAEIVVRDDTGVELRLPGPAQRIVSLAPHLTELIFAAGAGDRLVGVVDFSDYPPQARSIAHIGSFSRIDLEALAALKPDLVVGWKSGNPPAAIERARQLGLPVYLNEPERIEDVARTIGQLGRLAATDFQAESVASSFLYRLAELRRRHGSRPPVRVFYQVWHRPLTTVGGRQIISDLIRLCGGENAFGQLTAMAPTVGIEAVVAADPEAIVASGMDKARPEWLDDWRRWPTLTAVRRNNLFFVPPDLMQRHTPRLLDGAEQLCRHLEMARARRASAN